MNYVNGLAILRRISPDRELEAKLTAQGDIIAIDTGSGRDMRTYLHVDDDVPRESVDSLRITGEVDENTHIAIKGCTDGWSIVDESGNVRGFVTSLARAKDIVSRAKVTVVTEYELEEEEAAKAAPAKAGKQEAAQVAA